MSNNSHLDTFHTGTSEGAPVQMLTIAQVKALPSGDFPGQKVGAVLDRKREKSKHASHVAKVKERGVIDPVTVSGGVLIDGHHRVAAAEDAKLRRIPVRRTPGAVA